jgi:hypothetical protein
MPTDRNDTAAELHDMRRATRDRIDGLGYALDQLEEAPTSTAVFLDVRARQSELAWTLATMLDVHAHVFPDSRPATHEPGQGPAPNVPF